METLAFKVLNQWGFGAGVSLLVIAGLFYLLCNRFNKEDKLYSIINNLIKEGINTLGNINESLKNLHKENEEAHSYQKREHDRLEDKLDKISKMGGEK